MELIIYPSVDRVHYLPPCKWLSGPPQVMDLHRPLNCQSCCFPCCLQVFILPPRTYISLESTKYGNVHLSWLYFVSTKYGLHFIPNDHLHLQELEVEIEGIHAGKVFIFIFWKHPCTPSVKVVQQWNPIRPVFMIEDAVSRTISEMISGDELAV